MVHRGIGTARITYPTTVKLSPADPMTSANIPAALLRVPGVVSHPVRIGAAWPTTKWPTAHWPTVVHVPGPSGYRLAPWGHRLGYYPNLGQDAAAALSLPAAGVPTWIWLAGAGVLAVLVLPMLFGRRAAARVPKVRTVTRTTF
jgi:hypothetical protein